MQVVWSLKKATFLILIQSIYSDATHIFDGLNDFPTHIAHMRFGTFVTLPTSWPFPDRSSALTPAISATTPLYNIALQWLREDREYSRELERQGKKVPRGARRNDVRSLPSCGTLSLNKYVLQTVPTDSETFYKKWVTHLLHARSELKLLSLRYDYSH